MTDLTGVPRESAVISSHRDVPDQFKRLESYMRGRVGFEDGGSGGEGGSFRQNTSKCWDVRERTVDAQRGVGDVGATGRGHGQE